MKLTRRLSDGLAWIKSISLLNPRDLQVFLFIFIIQVLVTLRFILGDDICNERGEELADLYDILERDLADPLVMTLRPIPSVPYRRLIKTRNLLLGIMRECVDKKVKDQEAGGVEDDGSFLQMLMNELGPEYWYQYGYLCLGIILATRTNTAGVLAWTFAQLCNDDAKMGKVEEELKRTGCFEKGMGDVGGKQYPHKEFTYLDACMKESVRSYSNFLQFRKVMKPEGFEVEPGKIVPQGALICISPAESHHDEEVRVECF
jgi:cytochrome P450